MVHSGTSKSRNFDTHELCAARSRLAGYYYNYYYYYIRCTYSHNKASALDMGLIYTGGCKQSANFGSTRGLSSRTTKDLGGKKL